MIEFEQKLKDCWVKRTVNPEVIADSILTEEKLTLFYTANKRGVASEYLNREQTKPSLESIWSQINGKPKMFSFEVINSERISNGKVYFEADEIKGFKRTADGIDVFFQ